MSLNRPTNNIVPPDIEPQAEEMIAKWKQDRPVFDQSMIDDLCKYRPGHG